MIRTRGRHQWRPTVIVWGVLALVLSLANLVHHVSYAGVGPRTPPAAATHPPTEIKPSRNSERALTDAVNALRCLTTPGCFPGVKCESGERPRQVKIDRSWEQQAFCAGDLKTTTTTERHPRAAGGRCLVYSFGLYESSEWEEKMANKFGCDVYAFDPTSNFNNETIAECPPSSAACRMTIAERVSFLKLGLQGDGTDMSATHSEGYDAIDPARLRTLGEIVTLLGHEGRQIDVLRMDCEGCEYGVLKQLACGGDSHLAKQIMVEFHFQRNLGLYVDDDVILAGDAVRCLEEQRWGAVSLEMSQAGRVDQAYTGGALRFIKHPLFLLYATFRRVPESEKLGWERYGDFVEKEHEKFVFDEKHKTWEQGWEKKEKDRLDREVGEAWSRYKKLVNTREAIFDEGFELVYDSKSDYYYDTKSSESDYY